MIAIDVSIVLAVKNEQRFVESALLSILEQADVGLEVIVVDDGSTDETMAILARMASGCPRLQIFQSPGSGKVAAFNFGVSRAVGRFVCLFAGDDIMPVGSLAERWKAVEDRSSSGSIVGLCKLVTLFDDKSKDGQVLPRKSGRGALTGSSYLMNQHALARLFPVPEKFPNEDTWLELGVTHLPGVEQVHSDVVGCAWRVHSGNSINLLVDFDVFNERFTRRMLAIEGFHERHGSKLTKESLQRLEGLMECEESRRRGSVVGVLRSRVGLVAKLRALSLSNRFFYSLRSRFYSLFSGW